MWGGWIAVLVVLVVCVGWMDSCFSCLCGVDSCLSCLCGVDNCLSCLCGVDSYFV